MFQPFSLSSFLASTTKGRIYTPLLLGNISFSPSAAIQIWPESPLRSNDSLSSCSRHYRCKKGNKIKIPDRDRIYILIDRLPNEPTVRKVVLLAEDKKLELTFLHISTPPRRTMLNLDRLLNVWIKTTNSFISSRRSEKKMKIMRVEVLNADINLGSWFGEEKVRRRIARGRRHRIFNRERHRAIPYLSL